ncbi:MAG: hypothetical protein K6G26_06880, partial [Lachnospiraceae bacterium]|nr:hypothetical protein [Lachnospiraceae bacterium]
ISLMFIYIVPLEPFSDMLSIFNIAISGMKDPEGYLSNYNNQIPITVYLWIITKVFGKKIIIPKIFNIVCDVVILYFVYKIYQILFDKKDECKSIVWFVAPFLPVILYTNHIYNDVLYTALTMTLLYMVLKSKWSTLNYVIMCVISVIQYVIRPVGIIYIIALTMHMVLYRKDIKKAVIYVFISMTFITLIGKVNDRVFNVDKSKQFPVWSFIQMGVNEEEFGFQDGTHSHDWTMDDCIKKYKDLGVKKVLTIYGKKTLWMWSEGTYQAERYGFGDSFAQFSRENSITQSLLDVNNSFIRIALEKLMKAQYYIYMVLALIGIVVIRKGKKEQYNRQAVLMYLICGFFCFYLLWEIKSRYIYSMYPIIMIYAYAGWERVCKEVLKRKNKLITTD